MVVGIDLWGAPDDRAPFFTIREQEGLEENEAGAPSKNTIGWACFLALRSLPRSFPFFRAIAQPGRTIFPFSALHGDLYAQGRREALPCFTARPLWT